MVYEPVIEFGEAGEWVRVSFPYHPDAVAGIKAGIPKYQRSFDPATREWRVAPSCADAVERILRRIWGDGVRVIRPTRRQAPPPPPPPSAPTGGTGHYATLHLLPSAPPELVEAAWKCLLRMNHPDTKPPAEVAVWTRRAQAINEAHDAIASGRA